MKNQNIVQKLRYYNLIPFLLMLGLLISCSDNIYEYVTETLKLSALGYYGRFLSRTLFIILKIGMPCGLLYIYGKHYFSRKYKLLTGRSLGVDKAHYNRTYNELLRYFKDAEPQKMDISRLPKKRWSHSHGLVFGKAGDRLIGYEPNRNGIVCFCWGAPGVGKTSSVIITSARQFGLYYEDGKYVQKAGCMVLDMKGDVYEANKDYRNIKRFSITDYENSCHYDPLGEARKMDEADGEMFIVDLSTILLPYDGSDDGVYFTDVARDFFTGILLYSLYEDPDVEFPAICEEIALNSYDQWIKKIRESDYTPAQKYINKFQDENEKNVGGGYSKLSKALTLYTIKPLKTLLLPDDNCISPADLEGCVDVYIQVDPTKLPTYGPIVALLFNIFMAAALHRGAGQDPPLSYIIDEFGQLPFMPIISQSAALMRAYNASILISTQT